MKVRFSDRSGYVREGRFDGDRIHAAGRSFTPEQVAWLPPSHSTKVICLARNVATHAAEHDSEVPDRPSYFLKPPSSLAAHRSTVTIPEAIDSVEYEAELAAVIARQVTNVEQPAVDKVVAGLTCMNDLSNRADQRRELNWVRGKAFDGAAPIGPGLVDPGEVPSDASIELSINGEVVQSGRRSEYEFDLESVLVDLSRYLTLEPGDVIALGTPAGVGPIEHGDSVNVSIEGIGTLSHTVEYASHEE